jgi:hypothetical protein
MGNLVDKISSPRAEAKLLKAETPFLTTSNNNNNNNSNNNKYILSCGRIMEVQHSLYRLGRALRVPRG